jgi:hypothetical protein
MRAAVLLFAALASVAACGPGTAFGPKSPAPQETPSAAKVRFINGVRDGKPITLGGPSLQMGISDLAYGALNPSGFISVPGSQRLKITVSPQGGAAVSCATPYGLSPGAFYTVVVVGTPVNTTGNQRLQCQIFVEQFAIPPSGQAQVLAHFAAPRLFLSGVSSVTFGQVPAPTPTPTPSPVPTLTPTPNPSSVPSATPTPSPTFSPSPTPTGVPGTPTPPGTVYGTTEFTSFSQNGVNMVSGTTLNVSQQALAAIEFYAFAGGVVLASTAPCESILGAANRAALPDPNNIFPFANSTTMSLYLIDAPTGKLMRVSRDGKPSKCLVPIAPTGSSPPTALLSVFD